MARIRTIKPEFFRHEGLQDLEAENPHLRPMLVFAGLWCHADRNGVFPWLPRQLALDILPFLWGDNRGTEMAEALAILEAEGFIERFEAEGKTWGFIPGFERHQSFGGKEAKSDGIYPKPPGKARGSDGEVTGKEPGSDREVTGKRRGTLEQGIGNREQGIGNREHESVVPSSTASALSARAPEATQPRRHTRTPRSGTTFNPHEREPTPDEIRTHGAMVGFPTIDAEAFLEHYRAVGWMRGSTPITDWRPLVSRWRETEKIRQARGGSNGRANGKSGDAGGRARGRRRTDYDEVVEGPYDDGVLPGDVSTE